MASRSGYDWLYRRGMTPWEQAAATQQDTIRRLLNREELEHPALGVALDLGCGTGVHTLTLADHGWRAWGVDSSAEAIARATARAMARARARGSEAPPVRFDLADIRRLDEIDDPPTPVSFVVDLGCYHGIRPAERPLVAGGITRLAAPDATMLVVAMHRRPTWYFPVGVTAEGLRTDFPDWDVVDSERLRLAGVGGIVERAPFTIFRLRRAR